MTRPTSDAFRVPRIPRLTRELRQQGQLDYLFWRLPMYLKDRGALFADRRKWMGQAKELRAQGAGYEAVITHLEGMMRTHTENQLRQIQAIFNERTDD